MGALFLLTLVPIWASTVCKAEFSLAIFINHFLLSYDWSLSWNGSGYQEFIRQTKVIEKSRLQDKSSEWKSSSRILIHNGMYSIVLYTTVQYTQCEQDVMPIIKNVVDTV